MLEAETSLTRFEIQEFYAPTPSVLVSVSLKNNSSNKNYTLLSRPTFVLFLEQTGDLLIQHIFIKQVSIAKARDVIGYYKTDNGVSVKTVKKLEYANTKKCSWLH
jgi:hypothetical protein